RQLKQQKHLVELSRAPIFVWEVDGNVIEWNRGSEELYGYSRAEAIGRPPEQLLGTITPNASMQEVKERLAKERSWSGELRQFTKDRRPLTVEARLQLESFDGRHLVLESARDITERKEWEDRQRMLLSELSHRIRNTFAVV